MSSISSFETYLVRYSDPVLRQMLIKNDLNLAAKRASIQGEIEDQERLLKLIHPELLEDNFMKLLGIKEQLEQLEKLQLLGHLGDLERDPSLIAIKATRHQLEVVSNIQNKLNSSKDRKNDAELAYADALKFYQKFKYLERIPEKYSEEYEQLLADIETNFSPLELTSQNSLKFFAQRWSQEPLALTPEKQEILFTDLQHFLPSRKDSPEIFTRKLSEIVQFLSEFQHFEEEKAPEILAVHEHLYNFLAHELNLFELLANQYEPADEPAVSDSGRSKSLELHRDLNLLLHALDIPSISMQANKFKDEYSYLAEEEEGTSSSFNPFISICSWLMEELNSEDEAENISVSPYSEEEEEESFYMPAPERKPLPVIPELSSDEERDPEDSAGAAGAGARRTLPSQGTSVSLMSSKSQSPSPQTASVLKDLLPKIPVAATSDEEEEASV